MIYTIVLILGLIIGSFLNVCIYRLPRNLSIVKPASSCPNCGAKIKPWDNIPVLSYILLKGKCRGCGEKISIRYPLVEFLNGIFYLAAYVRFDFGWHLLFIFIFLSTLIVITFIDIDYQIIPDLITIPGIGIGLLAGTFFIPDPFSIDIASIGFKNSILGFLVGGGIFYLIAVVSRGGMGGGDIKMMAMIGAFLGWKSVLLTTFIGSLVGSFFGILLMIFKGIGRKTKIAFGPFLAIGAITTLFKGKEILYWYLNI
jgi:leader peptidase (prepilin peptidase)/N-methyltransferase